MFHTSYRVPPGANAFFRRLVAAAIFVLAEATAPDSSAGAARSLRDIIAVEPGATCLDASTLAEHIRSWLGSDSLASDVSIQVRGSPDQPAVVGFQAFRGGQVIATRRFNPGPGSCDHLHAAVGLAIAMALDPSLVGELANPARPSATPGAVLAEDHPGAWAAGASALAATNVLANLALGADAHAQRSLSPAFAIRPGLFALAALPDAFGGLGGHFDLELVAAYIELCGGADLGLRTRIQGCAGFAGGAIVARGHSFTVSQTAVKPWMAVTNDVDAIVALGARWSIDLSLGAVFPLQRMSVVVVSPSGGPLRSQDLAPVGEFVGLGVLYRP